MTTSPTAPTGSDASPTPHRSGRWELVVQRSRASFTVRDKLVTVVHGTLPVRAGVVVIDGQRATEAEVTLSVAGIETGNAHRDRDVRRPPFLDAAGFPDVVVRIAEPAPAGAGVVPAVVRARGAEAPVVLTVTLVGGSATEVRLRVTGRLDRRPLGIRVPSVVIGRFLELQADLTFRCTTG